MFIFTLLSVTLIALAVFGAGVFPFTTAIIAALLSVTCIACNQNTRHENTSKLTLLAALLVGTIAFTAIPMPAGMAGIFGSERVRQNLLVEKALTKASGIGIIKQHTPYFSITRNRAGTERIILLLIAAISIAVLSSRLYQPWKNRYIKFLVLFITLIAAAGFISQWVLPQGKNIWWLVPVPHGQPVGCFINRNHFGGFAALACAPSIFLLAESIEKKKILSALLWTACFIMICGATVASMSKGAWLAMAASMLFAMAALICRRQILPVTSITVLSFILLLAAFLCPNRKITERFESLKNITQSQSAQLRLATWKSSIAILRDYPFAGAGANAFRMVFPQYRTASTRKPFEHAENEYVQIPVEFGIPAAALLFLLLIGVGFRWKTTFLSEQNLTITLCLAGALIAAAVHALTDFALRIPLYLLTLSSMLGLILNPAPDAQPALSPRMDKTILLPVTALFIILCISLPGSKVYRLDSIDYLKSAQSEEIASALSWSPTSWHAWYQLGRTAISAGSNTAFMFGEECLSQAAAYDPRNHMILLELSQLRLSLQDIEGAQKAYHRARELRPWKQIKELEELPILK